MSSLSWERIGSPRLFLYCSNGGIFDAIIESVRGATLVRPNDMTAFAAGSTKTASPTEARSDSNNQCTPCIEQDLVFYLY